MFAGNLLALNQTNFKRLLAYSSIAHLGYLMITLLTGTESGIQAAIFYMISYMITTVGAFGIISLLSVCDSEAENTEDLKGLFWKNPWIAIVLSLALLSLAGIPLTAGFIAKFYLVLAGIRSGLWLLVMSLVINSVISIYYYLRIIKIMFTESASAELCPVNLQRKPGTCHCIDRYCSPGNNPLVPVRDHQSFFGYYLTNSGINKKFIHLFFQ